MSGTCSPFVPQGRLSRSEWRTVGPVAQRSGLCCSTNPRQTCITPRLYDVASREAVKFNDTVKRPDERQTTIWGPTSHTENPPLVRVRLNRLLGILLVF